MKLQEVGILVVDDVNGMRIQIKEMLKGIGFERVLVASNGAEAQRLLKEQKIQMVLSDWHMEPVNGLELLNFVRSNGALKSIAFVMLTAENTRDMVLEAVVAGVDDYLMKPLTAETIQDKIFKMLVRKKVLL